MAAAMMFQQWVPLADRPNQEKFMTFKRQVLAAVALTVASIASASAQAPLIEKNVSMKMALAIIEGTLAQCAKDGYKVSVVIVDNAGLVRASLRGDGSS